MSYKDSIDGLFTKVGEVVISIVLTGGALFALLYKAFVPKGTLAKLIN